MILILILLFLVVIATPAFAQSTMTTPVPAFIAQEQGKGIPLIGFSGTAYSGPSCLQYDPNNPPTPQQITTCQNDAATFNFTPQNAPNYTGFMVAVITTPGVTVQDIQVAEICAQPGLSNTQLKAIWTTISSFATHPSQIVTLAAQYFLPVQ